MKNHVHIGPGTAGLGFVIPIVQKSKLSTILVGRKKSKSDDPKETDRRRGLYRSLEEDLQYFVQVYGGKREVFNISQFIFFDQKEEEFIDAVADPATILLTTAVFKDGLQDLVPLLAKALTVRLRNHQAKLYIIACENPPATSKELRENIQKKIADPALNKLVDDNVFFLNAMVDRVVNLKHDGPPNEVEVEAYHEWIVECPPSCPSPDFLEKSLHVARGTEQFAFYEKRKAWLVNGTHYALALYGYGYSQHFIHDIMKRKYLVEWVRIIQDAFVYALNNYAREKLHLSEESFKDMTVHSLQEYAAKILDRFETGPNTPIKDILRITEDDDLKTLSQFRKGIETCASLLEKSVIRITGPFQTAMGCGDPFFQENPETFKYIAECFSLLIIYLKNVFRNFHYKFRDVYQKLQDVVGWDVAKT